MSRVREATTFRSVWGKLFYRFFRNKVVERLGKEIEPVQVLSNHPKVLWGYGQLSQAIDGDGLLPHKLKSLICARAASHIGCLF
jgi:hypothetical protein